MIAYPDHWHSCPSLDGSDGCCPCAGMRAHPAPPGAVPTGLQVACPTTAACLFFAWPSCRLIDLKQLCQEFSQASHSMLSVLATLLQFPCQACQQQARPPQPRAVIIHLFVLVLWLAAAARAHLLRHLLHDDLIDCYCCCAGIGAGEDWSTSRARHQQQPEKAAWLWRSVRDRSVAAMSLFSNDVLATVLAAASRLLGSSWPSHGSLRSSSCSQPPALQLALL